MLLLVLLLPWCQVKAQSTPQATRLLDSLRHVAAGHPADTFGSRALARLLAYHVYRDTAQARQYGRQALALATRLHDTVRLAKVEYELGTLAAIRGQNPASIAHHQASVRYFQALSRLLWVGHNERNIGTHYAQLGQYPTAMRYLLRSLERRTAAADSGGDSRLVFEHGPGLC